ncbi:ABC-type transport auxiliary lipoprotein family protein [Pigmentiphaga kullae]|uniref:Cholesterol transport system auxiliary component n=1 Tax=Pigmentiphaga kullae TaxID=151784 RepID=A0A4Q7N6P1_9BURK|nr:ABC-type transport auxiliary lipoprotein family protein [Pigmentiphaga kullae]RZS77021.1 cholesterol transport system auxiliary component [Pigmentiphaga kullae]
MRRAGAFIRWAGISLAALASACTLLPEQKTVDIYRLPSAQAAASQGQAQAWSLRIRSPHADATLDSARIAVIVQGDQISTYGGARWTDAPPALLRARLAQAFRLDGRVASVSTTDSNVRADLELDSDLRAFQSEYRGSVPYAVVSLDVRLISTSTRRVVASRSFEMAQPADGVEVPAVVSAFGLASDALAAQVVRWAVEQGAAAQSGKPE